MARNGITLDTREFTRAIFEYKAATRKGFAESCDHALLNLAIKTFSRLPKAKKSDIRALRNEAWWPKYIAKLLSSAGEYDAEEAAAASKRIIGARSRSVSYLKSGFSDLIAKAGGRAKGRRSRNAVARVVKAAVNKLRADFLVVYRARSGRDKSAKEIILKKALNAGLKAAARDMKKYAEKKLREAGRKHSGRR